MKRYLNLTIAAVVIVLVSFSCLRKGDNDPLVSLRTRTNRLTGTWKLISGIETTNYTSNGSTSTSDIIYEPGIKKMTASGSEIIKSYSNNITFEKKNNFTRIIVEDFDEIKDIGSWTFLQKNKNQELRKKEAFLVSITQNETNGIRTVNSGLFLSELFIINRLTNKELNLKGKTTENYTSGDVEVKEYELFFEKQ
ncbi:hypothetical protein OAD28_05100 [Flavobacteriales bacterium]|jgi:hypothetical protein|nr:hypothetical protein [Flavobacteriales bacterium]